MMFEYLNYGALGIFGFLGIITILININSKKSPIGLYSILLILVGLIFFSAYDERLTALKNINEFKNKNAILKCVSGGGLYTKADTYRVSLDDGWQVDKDYFIKESFMVRANKCEKW